jgi:hypothetical protein
VEAGGSVDSINMGTGTNTLEMKAGAGTISTVNGGGTSSYNLIGGTITILNSSAGDDTFIMAGTDVNPPGHILVGGGGTNTLIVPSGTTTWTLNNQNDGQVNSSLVGYVFDFTSMQNITGGSGNDNYIFTNSQITGLLDGGGGFNTITGPNKPTTWIISGPSSGSIEPFGDGVTNFINIQQLIGTGGNNSLTGPDSNLTWYITSTNNGYIPGIIIFENFPNITGGSGDDTFVLSDQAGLSGTLDGGGGFNILDYSNYTNTHIEVNLEDGIATNFGHIVRIQKVIYNNVTLNNHFFTLLFNTFYLDDMYLDFYDYMFDNHKRFYIRLYKILYSKMFSPELIKSALKY